MARSALHRTILLTARLVPAQRLPVNRSATILRQVAPQANRKALEAGFASVARTVKINPMESDGVRLDKWLWAVRLFRTRSLAIEACRAGHVKKAGESLKPSRDLRVGDELTVRVGALERTVRVRALLDRRVGANRVKEYLEDLTLPEVYARAREAARPAAHPLRPRGQGRPTKRDRRILDRFFGDEE